MDRRQFIKGLMAAAVASQIPFSEAEAEQAYEALASTTIEDMGNGWYRCSMSFVKDVQYWDRRLTNAELEELANGTKQTFSTIAKAGDSQQLILQHGKVQGCFDLKTGTMKTKLVEPKGELADCDYVIRSEGGQIFAPMLEEGPKYQHLWGKDGRG